MYEYFIGLLLCGEGVTSHHMHHHKASWPARSPDESIAGTTYIGLLQDEDVT